MTFDKRSQLDVQRIDSSFCFSRHFHCGLLRLRIKHQIWFHTHSTTSSTRAPRMRAMVPQYNMSRYYRIIMFHPWPYGHWSFGVCAPTQFELSRYPKKNSTNSRRVVVRLLTASILSRAPGLIIPRPAHDSASQPLPMGPPTRTITGTRHKS
jgi:hypothetical protein